MGGVRFVDEIGFAFGWIAPEPRFMQRASHAVASHGRLWVIDPVADESALGRARELGEPAGVVQLLDRHRRDCRAVADHLGVPHYEVPEQPPAGAPFEVLPLLRRRWWHEVALWYPEQRTLVCADAVGTAQYYRAPGERLGVSPLLRLTPPADGTREVEPSGLAEPSEYQFVQLLPDACLLPVAQSTPAGHAGTEAELLWQPLPGDPGREHEQDSIQHLAVVDPPAARMAVAPRLSRQEWLHQFPELVVDQGWWHHGPPILFLLVPMVAG